jgi:hypothetical protein
MRAVSGFLKWLMAFSAFVPSLLIRSPVGTLIAILQTE